MRQAPVLAGRFATLFTSLDSLERFVLEHREAIDRILRQLGDKQEWAVKGLLDRTDALRYDAPVGSARSGRKLGRRFPGRPIFPGEADQGPVGERDFNLRLREFCRRAGGVLGAQAAEFRERKVLTSAAAENGRARSY